MRRLLECDDGRARGGYGDVGKKERATSGLLGPHEAERMLRNRMGAAAVSGEWWMGGGRGRLPSVAVMTLVDGQEDKTTPPRTNQ
nr:hypothetical protein CFP56_50937 [Quercus suber]